MAKKEDVIELEGKVVELLKGGDFKVQLENKIRILPGDTVVLEISPYDLTRGRITYRK